MTVNEGRRCALPGCYVVIEPEPDGRPQRKYCTAAHRAIARQMRREGTNRSASAPPLQLPVPDLPLPPLAPLPEASQRRRQLAQASVRRARAVAVLGSAGLLVTGGGLMVSSAPARSISSLTASPWGADPRAEEQWASQARVSLASLDRQLDEVTQTELSWTALPADYRVEPAPAPVRALAERKKLLQQQRTTVASELAAWQSMHEVNEKLAATESHVAGLDRALGETPRGRTPSQAESETARRLSEQRAMRARQRDAQRQELDGLREGVREAMSTPLPSDDRATKSLAAAVGELVQHPERAKNRSPQRPPDGNVDRPEATAPREKVQPDRQDIGNGAPPNSGRTPLELPRRPDMLAAPPAPSRSGPVGGALDGARNTVPRIGGQPRTPAAPGSGPIGGTLDTVKKPLDGVTRPGAGAKSGTATPVATDSGGTASGRRAGGAINRPVEKVVDTADSVTHTSDQPSRSEPRGRAAPTGEVTPRRGLPIGPATPTTSGQTRGGSGSSSRAEDAARIMKAWSTGRMGDVIGAAMEANQHQQERKQGSRASSYNTPSAGRSAESGRSTSSSDAARISKARSTGRMGDVIGAAMEANRHQHGSSSQRSRDTGSYASPKTSGGKDSAREQASRDVIRHYAEDYAQSSSRSGSGSSKASRSSRSSARDFSSMVSRYSSGGADRNSSGSASRRSSGRSDDSGSGGGKSSRSSKSSSARDFSSMMSHYSGGGSDRHGENSSSSGKRYSSSGSDRGSGSSSSSKRYSSDRGSGSSSKHSSSSGSSSRSSSHSSSHFSSHSSD